MSSTADDVRTCIEKDPFVREGLARGIISHSKLARWLQTHRGIEGTEAAIVSAIRRAEPEHEQDVFAVSREHAKNLKVHTRSGIALIKLSNGPSAKRRVEKLAKALGEDPRIFETDKHLQVVVDQAQVDSARSTLGEDPDVEVIEELAELQVTDPRDRVTEPPGLLSLVYGAVGAQGVSIRATLGSYPDIRLLVQDGDLDEAFSAVRDLTKGLT